MKKLKMHTPDLTEENFRKLAALFPNAITETKMAKSYAPSMRMSFDRRSLPR